MKGIKNIKITDFFIEVFYLAIIFLVPIYFGLFFITENPFELQKMVVFKILFLLLAFLSILKFIIESDFKKIVITMSKKYFYIPIIILLFSLISLLWSIDPWISFFGTADRQLGWLSEFYFFLFFCFLSLNVVLAKDKFKKIDRLIFTALLSSLVVAVYAISQFLGYDFLIWEEPAFITKRSMSTLGQPNFLGSFLILVIPLAIYFIKKSSKWCLKILTSLILIIDLIALICSGSRGAWLGLLGASIIALIWFYFKNNKKIFFSGLALSILCLIILLTGNNVISQRFKSAFDLNTGSSSVRITLWETSLQAISNRFYGYGLENQSEAITPYYESNWAVLSKVNVTFDRAHNIILDKLLTVGVIGLLLCLFFCWFIFKLLKKNKDSFLIKMLFISLLSYLISLLFNFSVVVTNIYFWSLLAILISYDYKEKISEENNKGFKLIYLIIIIPVAILIFFGIKREIKNLINDYYFFEAKKFFYQDEIPSSVLTFSYLYQNNPVYYSYKYEFISLIFDNYNSLRDESSRYIAKQQIEKDLNDLNNQNNNSFKYLLAKAQVLTIINNFSEADICFSKLQKKLPSYPNVYFKMAEAEEYKSNFNKAIEYYNQTLELLPDENLITSDINLKALQNYKKTIQIKLEKVKNK